MVQSKKCCVTTDIRHPIFNEYGICVSVFVLMLTLIMPLCSRHCLSRDTKLSLLWKYT